MLFDGDAAAARPGDAMAPRGIWPPFPWNPSDLANPLIGRDAALAALNLAFDQVVSDWLVRVQLLVSEYGMGKSRLLAGFVAAAQQREPATFVIRVDCPETGGPYRMWDAILREAFEIPAAADEVEAGARLVSAVERVIGADARDLAGLIAYLVRYEVPGRPVLAAGADEEALIARCVGALGRLLEALAFERPVLILVAHANRASARDFSLASAVEATIDGRPIMMVFGGAPALSDHLPGWDRFPVIRLQQLERPDAQHMLSLFFAGLDRPPAGLVHRMVEAAAGNAYALKSMVRFLHESGGITQAEGAWRFEPEIIAGLTLPENLEGVILARIGALTAEEREILAQAAVVGEEFWLGALVALSRQDVVSLPDNLDQDEAPARIRGVLAKFVSQRFIVAAPSQLPGEEAFRFRSDAHWRSAQRLIPATVRQRYHRVVGSWLHLQSEDGDTALYDLARHAEGAGHPGDAAVYYLRAARLAQAEYRSQAALTCLERARALAQPDQVATRVRILFALGELHAFAGATDEAKRLFTDALAVSWRMRDRRRGARALIQLAEVEASCGEHDAAELNYQAGLRLYEAVQDQPGVARASTQLGRLYWIRGQFEQALLCYRKSEHIYRALKNDRGIADVLHAMAAVLYDRGDETYAEALYTEALELRRSSGDGRGLARTLNNLGVMSLGKDAERSVTAWQEAIEIAEEIGDLGLQATLADNLGEAYVLLGRFDDADHTLSRAVDLAERTGRKRTLVDALRNQGQLRIALGELDGAEAVLARAREHASQLGLARLSAMVDRAVGDLAVARIEATGIISEEGGSGGVTDALAAYRSAAERFSEAGYDVEAARSHDRLAEMLEFVGRLDDASRARASADALRSRHGGLTPSASDAAG